MQKKNKFSSIEEIIKTAKSGKMYILVDDEIRENDVMLYFVRQMLIKKK